VQPKPNKAVKLRTQNSRLCSFVANFSLLFCAVYGKRYASFQFTVFKTVFTSGLFFKLVFRYSGVIKFLAGLGFSFFNLSCDQNHHSPVKRFFAIFGLVSVFKF
jgi:apolipoprotein N-acyltransferase